MKHYALLISLLIYKQYSNDLHKLAINWLCCALPFHAENGAPGVYKRTLSTYMWLGQWQEIWLSVAICVHISFSFSFILRPSSSDVLRITSIAKFIPFRKRKDKKNSMNETFICVKCEGGNKKNEKQVKRLFVLDFIFRAYCSYGKFTLVLWLNRHKSQRNAFFLHSSLYLCLPSRIPIAQEKQTQEVPSERHCRSVNCSRI